MGEGEHLHLGREQGVELRQVESVLDIGAEHRDVAQGGSGPLGDELPGHEVGVMLHLG